MITPEEKLRILIKYLEQEKGYEEAHKLIDRAEMEYAVMKTNYNLVHRHSFIPEDAR